MVPTRERLVTATNEAFRRHGYNGTSVKQVTIAAGAPTGSLYHFFPGGKDELAEAALSSSGALYLELFESIATEAGDVPRAITAFFDGAADVLAETDYIDICPIGTVAREVASTNERLRVASQRVFESWLEAVRARLTAGGLSPEEAKELALTLVASIEGGFLLARTSRDSEALRAIGRQIRRVAELALSSAPTHGA